MVNPAMAKVDLIWLGDTADRPSWSLGEVIPVKALPPAIDSLVKERLPASQAQAWLFWDSALGLPQENTVRKAFETPGEVLHAGLSLGTGGLPRLIDFVSPTWMLNRDPPADIEGTSWRLSLRCCLVRAPVLRQMGGVFPEFQTLDAAALEMGHRYIRHGVMTRHIPWLAPLNLPAEAPIIPLEDELRFIHYRYGRNWSKWALARGWWTHYISLLQAIKAGLKVFSAPRHPQPSPYIRDLSPKAAAVRDARVSVLIPTLERYPYLRTLLGQLETQTVKPLEVIVVDQTRQENRDHDLATDFPNLPLKIIYQDQPGQCSSRNIGLKVAQGDFILFIDDDDEVPPDLLETHLQNLWESRVQVSSGVAEEVGAGPLPRDFTYMRLSDVFPTNNTLIDRQVLENSGLFDLAYNRLARADGDLGMRVYLTGACMLLNPGISVLHHHAPAGGLRIHKARVITYASSRHSLTQRHLPSRSEIYLAKRYFSPGQVREDLWLRALGTFSLRGDRWRQVMKIIISFFLLPHTWWEIRARERQAEQMLEIYPQIPQLARQAAGDSEIEKE